MLVLEHLALFFGALASAKLALIDRRAPYTTMGASIVFFAGFAIGSFNVEPLTGGEPRTQFGMFALGFGGFLFMIAMLILEAIEALPDVRTEGVFQNAVRRSDPTQGETGVPSEQSQRGD